MCRDVHRKVTDLNQLANDNITEVVLKLFLFWPTV